jgi:O-antigen/teichoic acid export membrane protein
MNVFMNNVWLLKIKNKFDNILNTKNKIAIFTLVFWAFASRGLGLIREALSARLSPLEGDLLTAAMTLNENITTLLILGSLTSAIFPQVIKLETISSNASTSNNTSDKIVVEINERRNIFLSWIILIFSSVMLVLGIIGGIFSKEILYYFNSDLYNRLTVAGKISDFIALNQIALIGPIIFAIKTILGVFLNAKKSFKIYSLEGVISNIGSILGLTLLYSLYGITGAAWGLILGFSLSALVFAFDAFRLGFRFQLTFFPELPKYLWQAFLMFLPGIPLVTSGRLAQNLIVYFSTDTGQIASLTLALSIQGVFYGLMLAVGSVFLPDISTLLVKGGKNQEFWKHLIKYLRVSAIVSIVATVATVLGSPILLFIIKLFALVKKDSLINQPEFVNYIIILVAIGSIGIIFQAINEIFQLYFVALEENWYRIIGSISGNIGAFLCSYYLISIFGINAGIAVMCGFIINNLIFTVFLSSRCFIQWRHSIHSSKLINEVIDNML